MSSPRGIVSSTGNGGHASYPYFASKHAVVKTILIIKQGKKGMFFLPVFFTSEENLCEHYSVY